MIGAVLVFETYQNPARSFGQRGPPVCLYSGSQGKDSSQTLNPQPSMSCVSQSLIHRLSGWSAKGMSTRIGDNVRMNLRSSASSLAVATIGSCLSRHPAPDLQHSCAHCSLPATGRKRLCLLNKQAEAHVDSSSSFTSAHSV